jgi:hypothetical protein
MTPSAPPTIASLDVPVGEVLADLDRLHARLMAGHPSPELIDQVHEFLTIDPDIAHREYPPFAHTHKGVAR